MNEAISDLTCRVCLNVQELMVNIYEEVEDLQSNLSELLELCGGLKVCRADNFPKYLCKECTSELLVAAKFREKCLKTQSIFEQIVYNEEDVESIPEETPYDVKITLPDLGNEEFTCVDPRMLNEELVCSKLPSVATKDFLQPIVAHNIAHNSAHNIIGFELQEQQQQQEKTPIKEEDNNEEFFVVNYDTLVEEDIILEESLNGDKEDDIERKYENKNDPAKNINASASIKFDPDEVDNKTEMDFPTESKSRTVRNGRQHGANLPNLETPVLNFSCDVCGAAFMHAFNLSKHMTSHSCKTLYTCQGCSYPFSRESEFYKHSKQCVQETIWIPLDDRQTENLVGTSLETNINCFSNKTSIRGKATKGRKVKVKTKRVCPHCSKEFLSTSALAIHIRVHTGDRPFSCTECDKTFKTQNAVQLHLKRHSGSTDYKCPVCEKAFYEISNLRVHMRTHTGEKPHMCTTCGRRFSRVFSLKLHQRIHTGEKPHICDYCSRAFAQLCDLTTHIRTHTGERPHTCPICFKGCIKSSALSRHMEKHSVGFRASVKKT